MKLYLNETSPFSRVVTLVALLSENLQVELVWVDPWSSPDNLKRVNPFCIIPALELEEGTVLTESMVICQYLLTAYPNASITSKVLSSTKEIAKEMALLGSAKTLMEVAFKTVALKRFAAGSNELIQRGEDGLHEALLRLKGEVDNNPAFKEPTLAALYFQIALDYIQLRHQALYDEHVVEEIEVLLRESPFRSLLEVVSLDKLAEKPSFEALVSASKSD